jgi:hypothetical protein
MNKKIELDIELLQDLNQQMKSVRSSKFGYYDTILLLEEADELARSRKWTLHFALYVMYYEEMTAGDKVRAEACMNLLEQEFMNSVAGKYLGG